MPHLSIRVLGPFQVSVDGVPVDGFATDKVRALLAYLALSPGHPHRREALAGLLWPDFPERSARASLRNALANLRNVLGEHANSGAHNSPPPLIHSTRQTIQFNGQGHCWLDAETFEDLAAAAPPASEGLEQAVSLVRGLFLEGFTLADAAPFEEWLLLRREHFGRRLVEALDSLAAVYEGQGAYEQALAHARRRVELEPWQEDGQQQLMRLLAISGHQGAALAQYESYRQLLATDLGVEPSAEMQVTYASLLKGEVPPGPPASLRAVARERRVVGACPYRGLAAFREMDAPFFFGREAFVERLFQALHEQPVAAVIVGSSGSGKSSAVFAGLLPRLHEATDWPIASFRPRGQPFHALAAALIPLLDPHLGEEDQFTETNELIEALRDRGPTLCATVERALEEAAQLANAGSGHVLLIVDQFEELYTLCPEPETRRQFLETLLAAADTRPARRQSPLALLLTLRADFMGQALAHRPFADVLQNGTLILGPMTREELRAAIERPAELQGATLEAGLVERLLDDVGEEPGKLPLLEFALTLLWERLDRGWMTHAAYEEIGRVDGALARYAEEVSGKLAGNELEKARRIFLQLVQPGEGTEDTRRVATRAELGAENWPLVQQLADWRLVVTGRDPSSGTETVEVVHEALIQRWGRLQAWMEANRAFRIWQERLRAAMRAWEASDRDEGGLLRGAPLVEAEGWLAEREGELGAPEAAFVQAGVALRDHRQHERDRRRRRTTLALAGGLVVALVLALLAGGQWKRAEEEGQEALRQASVGLAAEALVQLEGTTPERAVLLALEALESYPYTPQAESALAQAVQEYVPYLVVRWEPYTWAVAWSPDGGKIAAGAEAGVIIWDAHTGGQWRRIYLDRTDYCNGRDVAWSPSGDRFVAVGERLAEGVDEACIAPRVWNPSREELLLTFTGHEGQANSVDWSPDGARIVSSGADGTARIWDADTGEELRTLSGHTGGVNDAVWSPDADRIITAAADGTAKVWDAATSAGADTELLTLPGHAGGVSAAAWSPGGDQIATAATDGLVRVWRLPWGSSSPGAEAGGEVLLTLTGHDAEVRGVAWSPDGERLASSSADGTARLWDAATGEELLVLHGLSGDLRNVVWSPSGDRLVAGGGTILPIWDVSGRPLRLSGHTDDVWDAQWSPDGRRIATTSYDGTARMWDVVTGEERLEMEHPAGVRFLAWSPDGTRIVTTCQDRFARVWDADSAELLLRVAAPEDHFFFVPSWSPDGSRFAAASVPDNMIRIFDATTGQPLTSFTTGDWVHRLSWSPEGDRMAVGGDGPWIWDTTTGEMVKKLGDYTGLNAEWSPDGERIAFYQAGHMVRIFDATGGEELLVSTAHSDDVWHTTWSPNGMRIASGDESGEVKVWDAATGEVVLSFRAPDAVYSVNWSPDGKYVAAGGYFNPPVVRHAWQSTEDLIAYARECCVMRELTPEERRQFGLPER